MISFSLCLVWIQLPYASIGDLFSVSSTFPPLPLKTVHISFCCWIYTSDGLRCTMLSLPDYYCLPPPLSLPLPSTKNLFWHGGAIMRRCGERTDNLVRSEILKLRGGILVVLRDVCMCRHSRGSDRVPSIPVAASRRARIRKEIYSLEAVIRTQERTHSVPKSTLQALPGRKMQRCTGGRVHV